MSEAIKQRKVSPVIDLSEGALKEAIKYSRIIRDRSLIGCIQRLRRRWHSEDHVIYLYDDLRFSFYFDIMNRATNTLVLNGGIIFHGSHDAYGAGGIAQHVCLTPTQGWSIHT